MRLQEKTHGRHKHGTGNAKVTSAPIAGIIASMMTRVRYKLDLADAHTQIRFAAFDTGVQIRAYGAADICIPALEQAYADCRRYERLFSRTIPSSDISRINAAQGAWVEVDVDTAELVERALAYCAASHGVFDITIGAASRLWNLKEGIIPSAEALAEATQHVDWHGVRVERSEHATRVHLDDPAAMIDLGGIAKGWIADALDHMLERAGVCAYVIDLGGNVLVRGDKPDGSPWKVGLPHPAQGRAGSTLAGTIELESGSIVTSGIYERACMHDGVLYHHVLSPRTGMSIETEYPAVSVVCERSIDAEGYSTTLLSLGAEHGRELMAEHPEILQAYFISWNGEIHPMH